MASHPQMDRCHPQISLLLFFFMCVHCARARAIVKGQSRLSHLGPVGAYYLLWTINSGRSHSFRCGPSFCRFCSSAIRAHILSSFVIFVTFISESVLRADIINSQWFWKVRADIRYIVRKLAIVVRVNSLTDRQNGMSQRGANSNNITEYGTNFLHYPLPLPLISSGAFCKQIENGERLNGNRQWRDIFPLGVVSVSVSLLRFYAVSVLKPHK